MTRSEFEKKINFSSFNIGLCLHKVYLHDFRYLQLVEIKEDKCILNFMHSKVDISYEEIFPYAVSYRDKALLEKVGNSQINTNSNIF